MNLKFINNCTKILGAAFLILGIFNNVNLPKAEAGPEVIREVFMVNPIEEQPIEHSFEGAGIKKLLDTYVLDSKYHEPGKFVVYYGELAYSGVSDYTIYDFIVVHDRNYESVQTVKKQGCKVFQYLSFGNKFEDTDIFVNKFVAEITELKSKDLADGIFLDECDVAYWEQDYPNQPDKCEIFYNRLKEITDYCKSIGIMTVVNGSRAFCELGDYYLWESFQGYWSTNSLVWGDTPYERTEASDGTVAYKLPLSEWITGGSCLYDGKFIKDGEDGYIEMTVDMDSIVELCDRKQVYDWVYFQWFGNSEDVDCTISAWVGDSQPFDEEKWTKLPALWGSKIKSWSGIGKTSKYLKIRMDFKDSKNLQINSIQLTYNYLYPYWDFNASNGEADQNSYLWNYNIVQRDYLWEKIKDTGNKIKVLAHTYGSEADEYKKMFSYLSTKIWDCYSFDYVHPRMQNIYDISEIDNPLGMLLKREGNDLGYFTGGIAQIDTSTHKYSLNRNEPDYWYKRAANIDGNIDEWNDTDVLYENKLKSIDDNINVKKLSVTDDSKYIYFSFEVEGSIEFEKGSDYLYEIYLNTTGQDKEGYTGTWWAAPFGADYKICNDKVYKWSGSYPKDDYKGWSWVGDTNMMCKVSNDKRSIEYRIKKDSLGGLESKTVKMYMYTEDTKTKTGNFIQPSECGNENIVYGFVYNQKNYKLNTPHGWFRFGEVDVSNKTEVGITWEQTTPTGTSVKAWMRTKQKDLAWSDWREVTNREIILGKFEKIQCCFGLYTSNGELTPSVKNVRYVFGN